MVREIKLFRSDRDQVHFPYAGNNNYGNRNKIGGIPDFLQDAQIPTCPDCGHQMEFYAQLDSIDQNYKFGDLGMLYVFVCKDCLTSSSIIQSY